MTEGLWQMESSGTSLSNPAPGVGSWVNSRSIGIVRRVNERCLAWFAASAKYDADSSIETIRQDRALWKELDAGAISRAARIPIFLGNFNFQSVVWWRQAAARGAMPVNRIVSSPVIRQDLQPLLREVLAEARTVALLEVVSANLLIGATSETVQILASLSLPQIDEIATRYAGEFGPRWSDCPSFWERLLRASVNQGRDDSQSLRSHYLQLLGSEFLNLRRGVCSMNSAAEKSSFAE
jgi:hypothetical protein